MPGKLKLETMEVFGHNHRNTSMDAPKHHYAVWNDKQPYLMTVRLVEGTITTEDVCWGFAPEHRIDGSKPILLGNVDSIETREQKRVQQVTHQGDDKNDVITVSFLFASWTLPEYQLRHIIETMQCVEFWVGPWSDSAAKPNVNTEEKILQE